MADKPLVVVFLATGAQGHSVAEALIQSGRYRVRGLTRSPESEKAKHLTSLGVEMVHADAISKEEVTKALEGAYGAYVVTNFFVLFDKEYDVAKMSVEAAKEAGVKHLIWSSLPDTKAQSGGKIDVPHFSSKGRVEPVVRDLGFEYYTFQMPAFYFQNLSNPYLQLVSLGADDEVVFSLPMKPEAYISGFDVTDSGPAALAIFDNPEKWTGKHVALSGFHAPVSEYAAVFEKVTKRKTVCKEVPAPNEEFKAMFDWFSEYTYFGSFDRDTGRQCYPKLKTFEEWLESTSWKGPTKA